MTVEKLWQPVDISPAALKSQSKLRLLAGLNEARETEKPLINICLGDPSLHPSFLAAPPEALDAIRHALESRSSNGYTPSVGTARAREAVAEWHKRWDGVDYTPEDIILSSGASGALDIVLSSILSKGKNLVLPAPGFGAYASIAAASQSDLRWYTLQEESNWTIDLDTLDRLVDDDTAAVLICNPSNPCGSNWTEEHVQEIVAFAARRHVLLIADEIYGHQTWGTKPFVSAAKKAVASPVITVSGLAKRFIVPGWRLGWILIHDPVEALTEVRRGMAAWSTRIQAPSSLLQGALPSLLRDVPESYFRTVNSKLQQNADLLCNALSSIPLVTVNRPEGAMYLLLTIDLDRLPDFASSVEFGRALLREEALFLMPGEAFMAPSSLRMVIANPPEILEEAAARLGDFVNRHMV